MRWSSWSLRSVVVTSLWAIAFLGTAAADEAKKEEGTLVKLDGLQSRTPADWKEEQPPEKYTRMRHKQFRIPKAEGDKEDAEMIIYYFGAGGGGGLEDNLTRWKGMFKPPDGKSIDDVAKLEKMKVGKVAVTYLDIHGTYKGSSFEKAEPKPKYRMLAVYFDSENGPYFLRLVGPAKTVEHHKKGFDEWLKAFK